MTVDPLDRMMAWVLIGNDLTVDDVRTLVEIARAARAVVDGKDWWDEVEVLRDALARLDEVEVLRDALARLDEVEVLRHALARLDKGT